MPPDSIVRRVSIHVEVDTSAPPKVVWELYAQPRRWSEWAPHVRSPRGLGEPEIDPGARGFVFLAGLAPVPVEITSKRPDEEWIWRVGIFEFAHTVVARNGGGSRIGLSITAPAPAELAARVAYAPLARALLHNLSRVAERAAG